MNKKKMHIEALKRYKIGGADATLDFINNEYKKKETRKTIKPINIDDQNDIENIILKKSPLLKVNVEPFEAFESIVNEYETNLYAESIYSAQNLSINPDPFSTMPDTYETIDTPSEYDSGDAVVFMFDGSHKKDLELVSDTSSTEGLTIPAGIPFKSGVWDLEADFPDVIYSNTSVDFRVTVVYMSIMTINPPTP